MKPDYNDVRGEQAWAYPSGAWSWQRWRWLRLSGHTADTTDTTIAGADIIMAGSGTIGHPPGGIIAITTGIAIAPRPIITTATITRRRRPPTATSRRRRACTS